MNKPKHIKLLEFLFENNNGSSKNISPWLEINFPLPDDYKENRAAWNRKLLSVQTLIKDLLDRHFIKYDYQNDIPISFSPQYEGGWPSLIWYSDDKDIVFQNRFFITSEGVDYLDKYQHITLSKELIVSNKKVNESTIQNNIKTNNLLALTIGISILTLIVSALTYKNSKNELDFNIQNAKSDSVKTMLLYRRLDTLQSRIYSLQQTILLSKIPLASHER